MKNYYWWLWTTRNYSFTTARMGKLDILVLSQIINNITPYFKVTHTRPLLEIEAWLEIRLQSLWCLQSWSCQLRLVEVHSKCFRKDLYGQCIRVHNLYRAKHKPLNTDRSEQKLGPSGLQFIFTDPGCWVVGTQNTLT